MAPFLSPSVPEITPEDLGRWQLFVRERWGLVFTGRRLRLLRESLCQRMMTLGLASCHEYYVFVEWHPQGQEEWSCLLNLLTNPETSFFRQRPLYDALHQQMIPQLAAAKARRGERVFRLWSAGCSIGSEAYSLAITALEALDMTTWTVAVRGSDLNPRAVAYAAQGRYHAQEIRGLPLDLVAKYFLPLDRDGQTLYQATADLRSALTFEVRNLARPEKVQWLAQDVIVCQNVLIYLEPTARTTLVQWLCDLLMPGGYLVVTPAEVVGLAPSHVRLERIQDVLAFRRNV